jgi:hypothetical protein
MPVETITAIKLRNQFNHHAPQVLHDHLREAEKQPKRGTLYAIVKPLPTKEEYTKLFQHKYTNPLSDVVANAFSEFESLAGEMQDWYDNLPQAFQDGDKGQQLQDAQSALEDLRQPDVPESLADLPVFYPPGKNVESRAARCSEAASMLRACVEELAEIDDKDERKADADDLANDLGDAADNAEGVDFPGMY